MGKETVIMLIGVALMIIALVIFSVLNESEEVYAANAYASPVYETEPQHVYTTNIVEINYIPTEPLEEGEWIMPEDVVNLDEFNQIASMLAQLVWGEARGLTTYEKSLIIWTVFNRYDDGNYGDTLYSIMTAPNQFYYQPSFPVEDENFQLAVDCLLRWQSERYSLGSVGRTLPKQYTSYWGDGKHNYFRTADKTDKFNFEGPDPYGDRPF